MSLLLFPRIRVFLTALCLPLSLLFILVVYDCLVLRIFCELFRRKVFCLLANIIAYLLQLLYSFVQYLWLICGCIIELLSTAFGKKLVSWVSTLRRNISFLLLMRFSCFWLERYRKLKKGGLCKCAFWLNWSTLLALLGYTMLLIVWLTMWLAVGLARIELEFVFSEVFLFLVCCLRLL
jgi:hypothetical protein